ncbi:spermidine/putrescine ABC transporter permease [Spirochaetia bacterium]|nr:spermidine/putrescine ABC transporter permease [Spirochaetia bacterium]GHU32265.1 spermidine/putrescine ABC transporter permease [Spirochaetia bacterium]
MAEHIKASRMERQEFIAAMLFISPWVIGFLAFTLYPICQSFWYSLTEYRVLSDPEFIGGMNYINLFKDKIFLTSLYNTGYIVLVGVPITLFCALVASILLNTKQLKGLSVFRVIFFIPTLVPLIINCILWLWLLQPETGLINALLGVFRIPKVPWLGSPVWAKPALILMMVWGCGGTIIIFLAGLQDIPDTLYESASLDGANFVQKTVHITLPMLAPIILYNAVTLVINAFQWFAEPFVMTEGGPNNATMFYSLNLYQNAFQFFKMGYASAMAWILLVIALAIIFFLFKGLNRFSAD